MYHKEKDLASRTPTQNDDEEENHHQAQTQQPVPSPETQTHFNEVMNKLPMKLHETAKDSKRRSTQMHNDFPASSWEEQKQHYVKTIPLPQPRLPVRNQVSLSGSVKLRKVNVPTQTYRHTSWIWTLA